MHNDSNPLIVFGGIFLVVGVFGWIGYEIYQEIQEPDSGIVTDKEHEEGYWDCDSTGCDWIAPTWIVWYEDEEGNEGDDSVTELEYASINIGDEFSK